jgi:hypothetical protein
MLLNIKMLLLKQHQIIYGKIFIAFNYSIGSIIMEFANHGDVYQKIN